MSSTGNWKGAERSVRDVLIEFLIPAFRKTRAGNYSISDFDVGIEGFEEWKFDSKYSKSQPFRHHNKLAVIEEKYCPSKTDFPILVTRNYKERFSCTTVYTRLFAMLLSYWLGFGTKEQLMKIYLKESDGQL